MKKFKNYSRISKNLKEFGFPQIEIPNLLSMQVNSFDEFLQKDVYPRDRKNEGLQLVFNEIFPVEDAKGKFLLEFIDYEVIKEKYSTVECIEKNLSYEAAVKVRFRLTTYDEEYFKETNEKKIEDIKEQEVFLGNVPLITQRGTFILNGAERVIISQLHRSHGVFFTKEKHLSGKTMFSAKVIPEKGFWLEFIKDIYDVINVNIDKRKKIPVTTLLRCVGLSTNEDLFNTFCSSEEIEVENALGKYLFEDIIDNQTGEVLFERNIIISEDILSILVKNNTNKIKIFTENSIVFRNILTNTILKDESTNEDEANKAIYNLIRPGEEPSSETAKSFVNWMFFDSRRYNLSEVGRYKINTRLNINVPENECGLTKEDLIAIVKKLVEVFNEKDVLDDIDNLNNRRVKTIGELLAEQYRIGLLRIVRTITERMSVSKAEEVSLHDLVNNKALVSVIQAFFLTGQLSQFMEQTNPLAAITHQRRLSALGPGGLTRDRAGYEVRDVHYSHYGRICPIETPEGPNIGLISSPAIYSRINKMGFIETPYFKVENGYLTKEIVYLDSSKEKACNIAPPVINIAKDGKILDEIIFARKDDGYVEVRPEELNYMDISPQQMVSVSAALIPFLEHDDANRALMGSNMQRQAVPLLNPQVPIVGTGMEKTVAEHSRVVAVAPFDGIVKKVTSTYIDIEKTEDAKDILNSDKIKRIYLEKYKRTNQDTCLNQRPSVNEGDKVEKGQVISDGPSVSEGRLALGRNMLVAFMPWYGYNYEDAIILNESVAWEDALTSLYVEVQEVLVRNMKLGNERLAYDIPNVPNVSLRNLDKTGIIRVGSVIKAGDIVVGKVSPKNTFIEASPEENLMRALFGDRASDVINSSLKAKPGMEGVVIDVKVFSRKEEIEDDLQDQDEIDYLLNELSKDREKKIDAVYDYLKENLTPYLVGEVAKDIKDEKNEIYYIDPAVKITKILLNKINFKKLNLNLPLVSDEEKNKLIYNEVIYKVKTKLEEIENDFRKRKDNLKHGDELANGVLQMVKVYIAKKRKISVGDKMAGRHGNKGVVSRISPIEDMPFMEDGTPVDIILNPLGVPSRMNIGQIFETHLGFAAKILGFSVETPVFDGATEDNILAEMKKAKLSLDGKVALYDGKTGEAFKEKVTVGVIYMLKLNHLVDDKMHARSTGPYSLITQQPLGGKAQHGGQRLGEMEVWALEAYGASNMLGEMLTIKSDDVDGRTDAFKAITAGEKVPRPGIPESFKVLVSELKSLGFDVEVSKEN